jgi:hypothetical protein
VRILSKTLIENVYNKQKSFGKNEINNSNNFVGEKRKFCFEANSYEIEAAREYMDTTVLDPLLQRKFCFEANSHEIEAAREYMDTTVLDPLLKNLKSRECLLQINVEPRISKKRKLPWPMLNGLYDVYAIFSFTAPFGIMPTTSTFKKIKDFDYFEHCFDENEKKSIGRLQVIFFSS